MCVGSPGDPGGVPHIPGDTNPGVQGDTRVSGTTSRRDPGVGGGAKRGPKRPGKGTRRCPAYLELVGQVGLGLAGADGGVAQGLLHLEVALGLRHGRLAQQLRRHLLLAGSCLLRGQGGHGGHRGKGGHRGVGGVRWEVMKGDGGHGEGLRKDVVTTWDWRGVGTRGDMGEGCRTGGHQGRGEYWETAGMGTLKGDTVTPWDGEVRGCWGTRGSAAGHGDPRGQGGILGNHRHGDIEGGHMGTLRGDTWGHRGLGWRGGTRGD